VVPLRNDITTNRVDAINHTEGRAREAAAPPSPFLPLAPLDAGPAATAETQ